MLVNDSINCYREEMWYRGNASLFFMYETIKQFYRSKEWQRTRASYYKYRKGLCERCLKKGIISTGDEVHHKIRLTRMNINNPEITVNFNNLELLCTNCHIEEHRDDRRNERRYVVNADGSVDTSPISG